ncbi:DUF6442 family protein [Sporosarcina siberiensis]|uniref:DUF6442 family protein n=1 Tax=Sporosarcina siberiensis TaxID=1365606 RepID=A0ABW4SIQ4_9BACL
MNKDEILKIARTQKLDEGRKYINDFALGAVGAFAFIAISLMIVYKNIINESYGDLLSLLIGMVGAFCYGKFVLTSKKHWFILFVIFLTGACAVFIELPGL